MWSGNVCVLTPGTYGTLHHFYTLIIWCLQKLQHQVYIISCYKPRTASTFRMNSNTCSSNQWDPDLYIYIRALILIFMVDMKSKLTLFITLCIQLHVAGFLVKDSFIYIAREREKLWCIHYLRINWPEATLYKILQLIFNVSLIQMHLVLFNKYQQFINKWTNTVGNQF